MNEYIYKIGAKKILILVYLSSRKNYNKLGRNPALVLA